VRTPVTPGLVALALASLLLAACGTATPTPVGAPIALTSDAFAAGEAIPVRHTCDGQDLSPPLAWGDLPAGTESLALVVDDPDAPVRTWVHWVAFSLPAGTTSLPEAVPAGEVLPGGGLQGSNSWQRLAYGGPCPPPGSEHHYVFTLYALDATLDLEAGADKGALLEAMEGHILGQGELVGRYGR
jgi:Raf kinase inhibitor-like YbhB/YbcL family protein